VTVLVDVGVAESVAVRVPPLVWVDSLGHRDSVAK
jgi:hypothetical protein